MKIIRPVSTHDWHLLDPKIRLDEHLDGLRGFEVVLAPSVNVAGQLLTSGYVERLQAITRKTSVLEVGYTETNTWPGGPNRHWARTALALDSQSNGEAWFWDEGDCWPVVSNWALRLNEEHQKGKKPFTGCLVNTPHKDKQVRPNDLMMMGCAVYRHDLSSNYEFRPILDFLLNANRDEQPWDLFARGLFRKWGVHPTDLIGDRWNTLNYRVQNGQLECDAGESRFHNIAHKSQDIRDSVVIHGCKDDSLAKLVMSGAYHAFLAVSRPSGGVSAPSRPQTPITPKGALEALAGRPVSDEEHKRFLEALEGIMAAPVPKPIPSFDEAFANLDPNIQRRSNLIGKVEIILASHANIRVGKLASEVGMDKEELKKLLDENGYYVAGVSQWVKKKA